MNPLTGNDLQANGERFVARVVAASPAPDSYTDRLIVIRDTLMVFGMQVVFRATMFLRHLNY